MPEEITIKESNLIENKIFHIRGVPVMLDSDLAELYGVTPKRLNEQVQRNTKRFPNHFMFKLIAEEWESLRSQIATLEKGRGQHKKYLPFVFTEQGVAMLSSVLKSDTAINVSIQIIDAFIKLRKQTFHLEWFNYRMVKMEDKLMVNDHKFHKIFELLEKADTIPTQGIFFNGQIFDAYKFASDIIKKAKKSIILIDNYVDENTLALVSKRDKNVEAIIFTEKNLQLTNDIRKHDQQYPPIIFRQLKDNHDRFLIIDRKEMYHIGASLKDLGKKLFAFSKMDAETKRLLTVVGV